MPDRDERVARRPGAFIDSIRFRCEPACASLPPPRGFILHLFPGPGEPSIFVRPANQSGFGHGLGMKVAKINLSGATATSLFIGVYTVHNRRA
jgi:hypothetical protein